MNQLRFVVTHQQCALVLGVSFLVGVAVMLGLFWWIAPCTSITIEGVDNYGHIYVDGRGNRAWGRVEKKVVGLANPKGASIRR